MNTLIKTFINKYTHNYNRLIPLLTSSGGTFSAPNFMAANTSGTSPLERARKSLAKNQQTATPPPKKPQKPLKPIKSENTEQSQEKKSQASRPATDKPSAAKRQARTNRQPKIQSRRVKRPPIIIATVTGLLLSAIVLLAATGLYGAYCFSQGAHGDASVTASTIMYALAVFVGCFWSSAVVKRQSYAPPIIIGAAYLIISLVISAKLFPIADFKFLMILEKVLLTAIAGFAGYALSLIPYLINKAVKRR